MWSRRPGLVMAAVFLAGGSLLMAVSVPAVPSVSRASAETASSEDSPALPTCTGGATFSGYYTYNYGNRGIQGDVDYDSRWMVLSDNSSDHAARFIGSRSQADGMAPVDGWDFIYAGWAVGAIDGTDKGSVMAYAEVLSPLVSAPTIYWYPTAQYPWGNRFFTVYWTGMYEDGGRGVYNATITVAGDVIGSSAMIDPMYVRQKATIEGEQVNGNWCPYQVWGLFGSNGDTSNIGWDNSTILQIWTNDSSDIIKPWTPANIDTRQFSSSVYNLYTYNDDDVFRSSGGGS